MGRNEAEQKKDELLRKTSEELINDLKERWPNYNKWVKFPWGWWKPEDKVHWPRFDGLGEAKAPFLNYSGRHDVPPPKPEIQTKLINNTYYRSLYLMWKILHDELGREKANEMMGYMWLGLVSPIVRVAGQIDEKDRNCVAISKMYQQECYIEGVDIDIVEESPQKTILRVLCIWWLHVEERWKPQGIGYDDMGLCEPCIACCEYYGRAINPNITCTCTAHPLDTGSYCELVYEMKE
jgi:hypothetical protein